MMRRYATGADAIRWRIEKSSRADALAIEERYLPELRAVILKDTEIDEMDERLKAIEAMRGSV